jgi:hypothetical protein
MPARPDYNLLPFSFPAVCRKKVTAAFDGGRLTSDGGVMLLAMAERRPGIADRLARCFPDHRDPSRIRHTHADMIRARIHAIACGYEDADDLDFLRTDPAFKLACGQSWLRLSEHIPANDKWSVCRVQAAAICDSRLK